MHSGTKRGEEEKLQHMHAQLPHMKINTIYTRPSPSYILLMPETFIIAPANQLEHFKMLTLGRCMTCINRCIQTMQRSVQLQTTILLLIKGSPHAVANV